MYAVDYKEIGPEDAGQRLDNYLIRILKGVPKSHIYRIIRSKEVKVNNKRAQAGLRLQIGDIVRIPPVRIAAAPKIFVGETLAKDLQSCIIFEDPQLLVINKPSGIAVHGGSGQSLGVIEALREIRQDLAYLELVHRLDKETSGCLLIAKKRSALRAIQELLAAREITKTYWAILTHPWQGKKIVTVDVPLKKNILHSNERLVTISAEGKASETQFKLLENYQEACWVEAIPKTGRTHQIRVHATHLGHVIVGDVKYGANKTDASAIIARSKRLYLHARAIQFTLNGSIKIFQADLDMQFATMLKDLRKRSVTDYD